MDLNEKIREKYLSDMQETGISAEESNQLNFWYKKRGDIKVLDSSFLGTPESFVSGEIKVDCQKVRFLGGGLSDNLYSLKVDGIEIEKSMNISYILKKFYQEYKRRLENENE